MAIDFQGLLNVLHAAENEPNLKMSSWKERGPCGTTHCMIGSFCDQNRYDELYLRNSNWRDPFPCIQIKDVKYNYTTAIAVRFGITTLEANWLFTELFYDYAMGWAPASQLTKPQALARLRKFIYYKLHKQEMTLETARHISGRKSAVLASMA